MKDLLSGMILISIWMGSIIAYVSALVHYVSEDMVAMLILSLFIPPIGVIHGVMLWIS